MNRFFSVLRQNSLLDALDEDGLKKVVATLKKVNYPRGKLIYQAGDDLSKLLIIFSGQVRLFKEKNNGKTETLAYLDKGDFFGERPFMKQEPLSFSVEALVDSELLEIEKSDLEKIIADYLRLSEKVQRHSNEESGERFYKLIPKMATQFRRAVIAIYGSEDEIGKTTLAINLGVSLIRETRNSVVLLDLSIPEGPRRFSTTNSILGLAPPVYLSNPEPTEDDLDKSLMIHHTQLRTLALSPELLRQEAKAPEIISALIKLLKESFDYVLIDTSSKLTRFIWEALALSEMILFVTSSIDSEVPAGVFNQQDIRFIMNLGDEILIRSAKKGQSWYVLDRDYTTLQIFARSGFPFVVQVPDRPISRTISRLARDIGGKQIGLTLGGPGALGFTQIGTLEVLERSKIPIDMIVGSGLGAFIGAAYAARIELPQIKRSVLNLFSQSTYSQTWSLNLFKRGLLLGPSLIKLFEFTLKDITFRELFIPFKIVSTDTRTGEIITFEEDKVIDALQKSLDLSSTFGPLRTFETPSSDALLQEAKIHQLKQMGANIILATAFVTPTEREEPKTLSSSLPSESDLVTPRLAPTILTIHLDPGKFSWRDFNKVQELIIRGAEMTSSYIPKIEQIRWEQ